MFWVYRANCLVTKNPESEPNIYNRRVDKYRLAPGSDWLLRNNEIFARPRYDGSALVNKRSRSTLDLIAYQQFLGLF